MNASATELAHGSKRLVDDAARGLATDLTRHGKTVAAIVPKPRVSGRRAAIALGRNPLSQEQRAELKAACERANEAFQ